MKLDFNLCSPAVVYLILALIGTFGELYQRGKFNVAKFLMNVGIIAVVTYGLNWVCKKYSTRASWYTLAVLVFLPLLFALTMFLSRKMIR